MAEAATQQGLAIHAYVWMTHHIHVLTTPESGHAISQVFNSVGRPYVHYFNAAYGRSGTHWEGRYRATVVDSERYLLTLMRYIELNAVRDGLEPILRSIHGGAIVTLHWASRVPTPTG